MAKGKERIDVLIVKNGLATSREKAKAMVMAGIVFVGGQRVDKPGSELSQDALIELKGEILPFVSRGGLKLAKALEAFPISFKDKVVVDIGASTGGFTDCALQNGAKRVYAVDVGYGQLDWKLRTDPRVVSMERVNARYLSTDTLPEKVDWIVSDVAFISITKIFPAMIAILKDDGQVVSLIKPQFEAGREHVGKKGVVKDKNVHKQVIETVLGQAEGIGFQVLGLDYSPIRGPEGNIEYLAWLGLQNESGIDWHSELELVVHNAQKETE
ncbi:TlyA family RNA methyltransferase [Desulfosporosinus nitroreducens]|uniref:TlyA family RNA methyltransferase n=1 Tax=Desulfosporosinus nitroreducens TaxID=2018668 RepID=A0ABT8QNV2_9FIRM|nr:TlyA family RNA methyltransferase [Desulfosporosinus nitroreducens]MCO1600035.1 TlyA family RNA methyltransferase [Desulfosporosinus nitroreducens]MDO0822935.1 TlyA family RNA methyltransferase [Desulfosporosinus nitroreducens]